MGALGGTADSAESERPSPPRLGKSRLVSLLQEAGVRPRASQGQNFLVDPNVAEKICRIASVETGDSVLEVGAGVGALTSALVGAGAWVVAVEKDARLAVVLERVVPEAMVVVADALSADLVREAENAALRRDEQEGSARWTKWVRRFEAAPSWKLVSNLPYSVGTQLFLHLVEAWPKIASGCVMLQLEVAQRLVSDPASRAASAPTLLLSYFVEARIAARVPSTVFYPRPRVRSALVAFRRRTEPPVEAPRELLFLLIEWAFRSRRKMCKNALAGLKWFADPASSTDIFAAAGVDPNARPESLGLEGFAALANAVSRADPTWARGCY